MGDAELHARSLVGNTAIEYEQEDVGLKDLRPAQMERGVAPLFGGHRIVRRFLPLHAVALGQEDSEAEGFELLRQS